VIKKSLSIFLAVLQLLVVFSTSTVFAQEEIKNQNVETIEEQTKGKNPNDKITFIVDINEYTMKEKYNLEYPDMKLLKTDEGLLNRINYSKKSQEIVQGIFKKLGINYEIKFTYETLIDGMSLTTSVEDAKKIAALPEISSVKVNGIIPEATIPMISVRSLKPTEMIGADKAWEKDYTGREQAIAVIDSGVDPFHEIFKSLVSPKYTEEAIKERIDQYGIAPGHYFSNKIPFGFNYADRTTEIKEINPMSHGMHVSGIVCGNSDTIKGVAPDAQLIFLRVFSERGFFGGGTTHDIYNKAIDDAVKLGVDSINMSIGSSAVSEGRVEVTTKKALQAASEAGIVMAIAAGNDGFAGWGALENPKATNPDYGILSSPSIDELALSVASVDSDTVKQRGMRLIDGKNDKIFPFVESSGLSLPKNELEIVVGGNGNLEEIPEANGKYVLIKRGILEFSTMIQNAEKRNAAGVIVYDNVDGPLFQMAGLEKATIPSALITKEAGETILNNNIRKVKFEPEYSDQKSPTGYMPSNFSSWGMTSEGNLKPDISAPGGNIYSSINDNKYENMSGTSMASPHVAGGIALVNKYVSNTFPKITGKDKYLLIKNLLMSTAKPKVDKENNAEISPRSQGAGLMNLEYATESAVTVEGTNNFSSINLKNITGNSLDINAKLHNYGDKEVKFNYYASLNTDKVENGNILLKPENILKTSEKEVTVAPHSISDISINVSLEDAKINELKEKMPNGFFIDGFVYFKSSNHPEISAPFVGFFGNWGEIPVIEKSIYDLVSDNETPSYNKFTSKTNHPFTYLASNYAGEEVALGELPGSEKDFLKFSKEKIAFSPNGDGYGDFAGFYGNFLRNYKDFNINIYEEGKNTPIRKIKRADDFGNKNFPMMTAIGITGLNTTKEHWKWDGTNDSGVSLPEGKYKFVVGVSQDSANAKIQKMEFPVTIDITYPRIVKSSYDESTRTYSIENILEEGSGIKAIKVISNGKEEDITESKKYVVRSDKKISELNLLVEDYACNRILMPLDKAIRNGDEVQLIVNAKIFGSYMDSRNYAYHVENLAGEKVDEYDLKPGKYNLVIDFIKDGFKLKENIKKIQFEIGNEKTKTVDVEFSYVDLLKAELSLTDNTNKKAVYNIYLLDTNTGKEYIFKNPNKTQMWTAFVPEGKYKIIIKDLDTNLYYATCSVVENEIVEMKKGMGLDKIPSVTISKKRPKNMTVNVNRNGYKGPFELVLIGTDLNKDTKVIQFNANESIKDIKLIGTLKYKTYVRNSDKYGLKENEIEARGNDSLNLTLTTDEKPGVPVDKEMLGYKVNHGKYLKEKDFKSGFEFMQKELANAEKVLNNSNATQKEVDEAYKKLSDAIDALVPFVKGEADKSKLIQKIKEMDEFYASMEPGQYTEESIKFFIIALEAAKLNLNDDKIDQTKVDQTVDLLERAYKNLESVSGDKERKELRELLEKNKNILDKRDNYEDESFDYFRRSFENAKEILDDENSSTGEIKDAIKDFKEKLKDLKFKDGIVEKVVVNFDKNDGSKLSTITIDKNSKIEKPNDPFREGYIFKGWKLGNEIYEFDKVVTEDITLVANWEKIVVDKSQLEKEINVYDNLDKTPFTEESVDKYTKAFEEAKKVLENENATTEDVENSIKSLKETNSSLVKKEKPSDNNPKIEKEVVDKSKLLEALNVYRNLDKSGYTEESLDRYAKAYDNAKKVYEKNNSTKKEVEDNIKALNDSRNLLEFKVINIMPSPNYRPEIKSDNNSSINSIPEKNDNSSSVLNNNTANNSNNKNNANSKFKDINNHWAKDVINYAVEHNYFKDIVTGDEFKPEEKLTRAEFVTILGRRAGIDPSLFTNKKFKDVNNSKYYQGYIAWAFENKIVYGMDNETFAPDKELSREEMAAFISRFNKVINLNLKKNRANINFKDQEEISNWAKDAVREMVELDVLKGMDNNEFSPKSKLTRAQIAQVIYKIK